MTDRQFEDLSRKIDLLIRVSAVSIIAGKKQHEQIQVLSSVGFRPRDIAEMLGTTRNTVSVALSTIRKKNLKKQKGV